MRKIIILAWLMSEIASNTFCQLQNANWILGYDSLFSVQTGRTTINFNSGFAFSYSYQPMNFGLTTTCMSDSLGNLLFYSNGVYVSNRNDAVMMNGDQLSPSFYTSSQSSMNLGLELSQASVAVPSPGHPDEYYLFHCTLDTFDTHGVLFSRFLYYSIIDMSLDGGLGAVVSKNNILLSDSINQGGFAVCRHGNGRDWWIVCHRNSKNDFVEFLFTPNGISSPRILAIGSVRNGFNPTTVFSSDGKMLATIGADHGVDVFDFDRCSGDLSNHRNVLIPHWQGFLSGAFSSLGNYLYITNIDSVFQIDMNQTNLSLSLIASWDSTYDPSGPPYAALFHTARLAPDNKIYISTGNTTRYLHVINFPDQAGAACDLNQHAIVLPTYNDNSFPYQINFTLPAAGGTICDTLGLPDSVLPFQSTDENSVFVFPNPFESRLYLKSKKSKGVKIDLINSFGEILDIQSHIINESIELQTESLPHGIYFLSIKNETNTQVVKLVK